MLYHKRTGTQASRDSVSIPMFLAASFINITTLVVAVCFDTKQACLCSGRDEANDDVKSNLLVAIGSWLKLASNLPAAVSSRLAACLKEKDNLKTAALTATLQVSLWSMFFQCSSNC